MAPRPEPIDLGFAVADAESPRLELDGQVLTLRFVDWADQEVVAVFGNTIAVRWQEAEHYFGPEERYDYARRSLTRRGSQSMSGKGATFGDLNFRHLKMNFNAAGVLEVLCTWDAR